MHPRDEENINILSELGVTVSPDDRMTTSLLDICRQLAEKIVELELILREEEK